MVVRATIGALVYRLPFFDRFPTRIQTFLGSETTKITSIEISPEEVRPLSSPSQKIRLKMIEKRTGAPPSQSGLSAAELPAEIEEASDDTLKELDSQSIRQARVELYLSEQHDEFNSLINKNLREVMLLLKQRGADEPSWRRLVLELAMARTSEEATLKLNMLLNNALESVSSYFPFLRNERHSQNVMAEYESSALKMETAEFLDQLDYESKVVLLRQLIVDLGMRADSDDIVKLTKGRTILEETSMTDKIELLTLLTVRLWFIGLRYCVPITKLLYTKFKENDIMLLNNKNFSKLLTILVRTMEALEVKLNSNGAGESRPLSKSLTESSQ